MDFALPVYRDIVLPFQLAYQMCQSEDCMIIRIDSVTPADVGELAALARVGWQQA